MSTTKLRVKSAIRQHEQQRAGTNAVRLSEDRVPYNVAGWQLNLLTTTTNANVSSTTTDTTSRTIITKSSTTVAPSHLHGQPSASLRKIDAFIPSLNVRVRKPLNRSYSTLSSSSYIKQNAKKNVTRYPPRQTAECTRDGGAQQQKHLRINCRDNTSGREFTHLPLPVLVTDPLKRRLNHKVIDRQRSKSTSSSNSTIYSRTKQRLILDTTNNSCLLNGCTVTTLPNGICRIVRDVKEQELLPDRINYDKKGLTAIPIFENEHNLRLLSLQHNLINTFHIPKEEKTTTAPSSNTATENNNNLKSTANANYNNKHVMHQTLAGLVGGNNDYSKKHHHQQQQQQQQRHKLLNKNLNFQSFTYAGRYTLPSAAITTTSTVIVTSLLTSSSTTTTSTSNSLTRLTLKKSKSFANNNNIGGFLCNNNNNTISTNNKNKQFTIQQQQYVQKPYLIKTANSHINLKSFDSGINSTSNSNSISSSSISTNETNSSMLPITSEQEEESDLSCISSTNVTNPTPQPPPPPPLADLTIKNRQLQYSYGTIFSNLVFLDLYDNQIERIANLDGLTALTVLLLGKNRITDISGLVSLRNTLRVLDLHGNRITSISNKINCLHELKSLNLAGNQIRQINHNDFNGLQQLKELNLKRNRLKRINGFQHLSHLERVWLCHNDLHKVEDMASIAKAANLQEVTIENNPVSLAGDCVSFLVSYLPKLQTLSQMVITEQVRKAALIWRNNRELGQQQQQLLTTENFNTIRREEIISNARTNWELLRSQQQVLCNNNNNNNNNNKQSKPINNDLQETNESNYEEFIKLPPIAKAAQQNIENAIKREGNESPLSISSLGANVNSLSSCYTTDEEAAITPQNSCKKMNKPNTVIETKKPSVASKVNSSDTSNNLELKLKEEGGSNNATFKHNEEKIIKEEQVKEINGNILIKNTLEFPVNVTNTTTTTTMFTNTNPIKSSGSMMNTSCTDKQLIITTTTHNGYISTTNNSNSNNLIQGMSYYSKPQHNTTTQTTASNNYSQQLEQHGLNIKLNKINNIITTNNPTTTINTTTATTTTNATALMPLKVPPLHDREREQGGDYLIEICGRHLNIYGHGALRFVDKQWNPTKAMDVLTLNFSYINFNNIVPLLQRIKVRFPHAENFIFRETNICQLGQLNALAELQGISTLFIDPEGNTITNKVLWRQYAIYRLTHWGLKVINNEEITAEEITEADRVYKSLTDLILWSMPDSLLHPLLQRLSLEESYTDSKLSVKQWLQKPDHQPLRLVVSKEALQWKKQSMQEPNITLTTPQQMHLWQIQYGEDDQVLKSLFDAQSTSNITMATGAVPSTSVACQKTTTTTSTMSTNVSTFPALNSATLSVRERAKIHITLMLENTCNAVEKLHKLETLWPSILLDMVRNTLIDYSQLDTYVRNLMTELMK